MHTHTRTHTHTHTHTHSYTRSHTRTLLRTVAHIKDAAGMWWRYDDETVTQLGSFPLGDPSDHGSSSSTAAGAAGT